MMIDLYSTTGARSTEHNITGVGQPSHLTITATIFIPQSFLAGIWGMNFDPEASPCTMPELSSRFGYPFALALMARVAVVMILFFRRKGWLGSSGQGKEVRKEDQT